MTGNIDLANSTNCG